MEVGWLESLVYGFVGGLTEILPVSAQAHKALLLKFMGIGAFGLAQGFGARGRLLAVGSGFAYASAP